MVLGDPGGWANRFVTLDDRLLERIAVVWPTCVALLPGQPIEDTITINLVALLVKHPVARSLCHWIAYQHEPFGISANGAKFSKGKIDMAAFFDQDRERYIAYECKRLNVTNAGGRQSLATKYVTEGMMRFLTEQYAEGLPVGCMLGYVLDSDVAFARTQVETAIGAHSQLSKISGPSALDPLSGIERFLTVHKRVSGAQIQLRHAFLSH